MTDVKIHLPHSSVSYTKLSTEQVETINVAMATSRSFTMESEESYGAWKPVKVKRIFNPAMIVMVEIQEETNG